MFTRFKMNVQRYPRLFTAWLVGIVLAVAESYIPRLVGIDARHTAYANLVDLAIALVAAAVIYQLVFTNFASRAIFLEIADSIEGREVCTVAGHEDEYPEDEEFTEDEDETIEEDEPTDEEEGTL
jgi:hypothetical protein